MPSPPPRAADLPLPPAAAAPDATDGAEAERARRFTAVALPHLDAAYSLARYLAADPQAAEDIVQEAYMRAFRGIDGYRGGDARAWVLAIVRNCFYSWAKARQADPVRLMADLAPAGRQDADSTDDGDAGPEPWPPDLETPEAALLRADDQATVRRLVAALPAPFREVLVMREMAELSYRQIASVTGVPIGTVMSRLARARRLIETAWRHVQGQES